MTWEKNAGMAHVVLSSGIIVIIMAYCVMEKNMTFARTPQTAVNAALFVQQAFLALADFAQRHNAEAFTQA